MLEQSPVSGAAYSSDQSVELTISGGSTLVPDVVGRSRERAAKLLTENNLTEGATDYVETSDVSQIGQVLAQSPLAGTMAMISTPVTLTVGMESQPYQGELSLTIPADSQERILRVVLVIDGEERTKYEGTIASGVESNMLIPMSANVAGDLLCRVYLNGEMYQEATVTLR